MQETSASKPHRKFEGHTDTVYGVIHLPRGQRIITCSFDSSLRLWNLKNGLQIGKDWRDGKSRVTTIALSPDGRTVASCGEDGIVRLWNVTTGKVISTSAERMVHSSETLGSVAWSRDGQRIVSGSYDGTAKVWDVKSRKTVLGPVNTGHESVYAILYSPKDTMIASSGSNNVIRIWDAKTFELVTTLKGHRGCVFCLAWSPWSMDGNMLVSGSLDASIRTWDTTTWKQLACLTEHKNHISAIAISSNGRILASASSDKTARLWNLEDSRSISSPLQHASSVTCISFSADGRLLATGSQDKNVYTWDLSAIVKDAGFNNLLSDSNVLQDPVRSPVLDADANRHLPKPLNNARRLPQQFFEDTGDRSQSYSTQPHTSSSTRQHTASHQSTFLHIFHSIFRRSRPAIRGVASHGTPNISHPLNLTHPYFSRHHRPPEVDVPYTYGRARNVHATQQSKDITPTPNNIVTLNVAGTSQSQPSNDVMQQFSEQVHGQQPSLQPQDLLTATHTNNATTITSVGIPLPPDIAKEKAGRWTRFLCCISSEDAVNPQ